MTFQSTTDLFLLTSITENDHPKPFENIEALLGKNPTFFVGPKEYNYSDCYRVIFQRAPRDPM